MFFITSPNNICYLVLRLVDVVVRLMGDVFPELRQHKAKIEEIIKEEEESFGRTLAKVNLAF